MRPMIAMRRQPYCRTVPGGLLLARLAAQSCRSILLLNLAPDCNQVGPRPPRNNNPREEMMNVLAAAGTVLVSLLAATVLTPVGAADMTHERALNAGKEP